MAARRITTAALSVLVVALTGCGSQIIDRVVEKAPDVVETTTTTEATPATTTTVATTVDIQRPVEITTTTASFPVAEPVEPVLVDDIDPMLDEIDAALAELDQLFNDAAAALAAEEGEFIP